MSVDPASLRIRTHPDPCLRERAEQIDPSRPDLRRVAERMIELMFEAEGIGLAAPQVGLPWRLFVAHVPSSGENSTETDPATATPNPVVYVNPVLADAEGPPEPAEEGCLSLPDIYGEVRRPVGAVTIRASDVSGKPFEARGAGLLARCWQHEYDHLEGVLIIDKMSQISRLKNRSAIRKLERAGA